MIVLVFAMLLGALFIGSKGVSELRDRKAGEDFYMNLAQTGDSEVGADTLNETAENGEGYKIDFDELIKTCPDAVGWIRLDDTEINYPIVQGEDNDYYLNHLADRTANSAGSIMMNFTNDRDFNDDVTILHGHHMRNGSMFSNLDYYKDEEFYREHRTLHLITPTANYDVAVFAVCIVNGYTYEYPTSFADEAEFEKFIRKAVSSTGYETDVDVEFGDRLLLMSTCAYSFDGARLVVIGKIID